MQVFNLILTAWLAIALLAVYVDTRGKRLAVASLEAIEATANEADIRSAAAMRDIAVMHRTIAALQSGNIGAVQLTGVLPRPDSSRVVLPVALPAATSNEPPAPPVILGTRIRVEVEHGAFGSIRVVRFRLAGQEHRIAVSACDVDDMASMMRVHVLSLNDTEAQVILPPSLAIGPALVFPRSAVDGLPALRAVEVETGGDRPGVNPGEAIPADSPPSVSPETEPASSSDRTRAWLRPPRLPNLSRTHPSATPPLSPGTDTAATDAAIATLAATSKRLDRIAARGELFDPDPESDGNGTLTIHVEREDETPLSDRPSPTLPSRPFDPAVDRRFAVAVARASVRGETVAHCRGNVCEQNGSALGSCPCPCPECSRVAALYREATRG